MSVCHREGHFGAFYLLCSTIPLFVLFSGTGREWPSLCFSPVRAEQLRTYLSRGFDCPFVILKGGFWYLKKLGPKPRPALNTFCIFWQLKHAWFWCGEQLGWQPVLLLAAWCANACAVTCRGPVMGVGSDVDITFTPKIICCWEVSVASETWSSPCVALCVAAEEPRLQTSGSREDGPRTSQPASRFDVTTCKSLSTG